MPTLSTEQQTETLEEIAERIAGEHAATSPLRGELTRAILTVLRHVSNRICDECETVIADGSGFCSTCDNFTMPSDFYVRWVRRTEMEEALRNERERCAKVTDSAGRELRRMADAPLLEEAVSTRFKNQSAICDELTKAIREGK